MKTKTLKSGLECLKKVREEFRIKIENEYEVRAKDCQNCEVKGSCCVDEHFVNVHISRLEATAISKAVKNLEPELFKQVLERNKTALETLADSTGKNSFAKTYSCPLFEKDIGCLVHETAKPAPCINHACYENKSDLPPPELLSEMETEIGRLNDRIYRKNWNWLPIPEWLSRVLP